MIGFNQVGNDYWGWKRWWEKLKSIANTVTNLPPLI